MGDSDWSWFGRRRRHEVPGVCLGIDVGAFGGRCGWAQDQQAAAEQQQPASLDAGQLDQLVAPIALYPDTFFAQVLMASTYPLEVVQADRWAKANKSLKGDALTAALDKQDWDASVKDLVSTPTVLDMMSESSTGPTSRRCRARSAGRRDGRDPAPADKGASER